MTHNSPSYLRRRLKMNCKRKVAYLSAADAKANMEDVRRKGLLRGDPHVYQCHLCEKYHWGRSGPSAVLLRERPELARSEP